jgi:hypothetical protein
VRNLAKNAKKQIKKYKDLKHKMGKPIKSAVGRLPQYIDMLNDPFTLKGVKVPDLVSYPTGTFFTIEDVKLSANAEGECGICVYPRPKQHYYTFSNVARVGGNWVWTANDASGYTTINSAYDALRPVAMGIICEFYGPTTSDGGYASGTIYPRTKQSSGVFNPDGVNTGTNQIEASPFHIEVPLKNSVSHKWRPMDNDELIFFKPADVQSIGNIVIGFTGLTTAAVGSPSYTIKCRIITHYEGIPNSDAFDTVSNYGRSPVNLSELEKAFNGMDLDALLKPYIGYVNDGAKLLGNAASAYRTFTALGRASGLFNA